MINGKILEDEKTKKWGYRIWTGNPKGTQQVKILKEINNTFNSEESAKKEFQLEFNRLNNSLNFN